MSLFFQEKGMFKNLIGSAFSFRLMKVVHVELSDKGREVVVLEVLGKDLVPE
jgi:hypothetical protein